LVPSAITFMSSVDSARIGGAIVLGTVSLLATLTALVTNSWPNWGIGRIPSAAKSPLSVASIPMQVPL